MTHRTDFSEGTPEETAAEVSEALRRHRITAVMSGGGCVPVYSENKYHSDDLDFIDSYRDRPGIQRALAEIGFFSERDRYFKNESTPEETRALMGKSLQRGVGLAPLRSRGGAVSTSPLFSEKG